MLSLVHYSIKDLELLTGVKAHTLRIWEKRYSIIVPKRTETNIRYYDNNDLVKVLNISLLNRNGIKISKISQMSDALISEKVSELNLIKTDHDNLIESLILSLITLDEIRFNKVFSAAVLRSGFERAIEDIIFPFLRRIGVMWQTGAINPAQEHLITNIIRQKLIVAVDSLHIPEAGTAPSAILFLPDNELHELSLLLYNYSLRSRGIRTFFLGQAVPMADLTAIVEIIKPDFLLTVITTPMPTLEFNNLLSILKKTAPHIQMLISGKVALEYEKNFPDNVYPFKDLNSLISILSTLTK
jgi:MerR family transcriptional regulator, light-induced transcriptional regulator